MMPYGPLLIATPRASMRPSLSIVGKQTKSQREVFGLANLSKFVSPPPGEGGRLSDKNLRGILKRAATGGMLPDMDETAFHIPRQAATLRTMVEDRLRSAILTGHFEADQRLVERELCQLFGVGRTSVREALRQLEAEGLVTTVPHRGPTVSKVEYDDAEQIYAVRALLEGYAGEQFARHASAEEIANLAKAVADIEEAANSQDAKELLVAKDEFYSILLDGCGNAIVKQMLSLLHNRVNLLRSKSLMQPGRLAKSVSEIQEIFEAIKARDATKAGAASRHHVEMAARTVLSHLRQKTNG
jgi:DNA-binding GntR family transcriptional regulator